MVKKEAPTQTSRSPTVRGTLTPKTRVQTATAEALRKVGGVPIICPALIPTIRAQTATAVGKATLADQARVPPDDQKSGISEQHFQQ